MYGKLFSSMFEGSLYGDWKAIVTMQQMVILADADGVVDMTPQAISGKTSIPLDIIQEGIVSLMAEDGATRTPGANGVRIHLLDDHRNWGWGIVNYDKYKRIQSVEEKREKNRERVQRFREKQKIQEVEAIEVKQELAPAEKKTPELGANIPPTHQQVQEYCLVRGNTVNPQKFMAFYEQKGWMVGKNKMRNWRAAIRNWEQMDKDRANEKEAAKPMGKMARAAEAINKSRQARNPNAGIPKALPSD